MPNIKSAKKRVKVTVAKSEVNKAAKSELKTVLKKAGAAVEANDAEKAEAVRVTIKKIDQAVAKGILHKNAAARKKSQLTRKLNASNT